ncbi:class I SAM-dependent methyltransferase [Pseudomonas citronellolis]|uniref:class I SAM-dependent methyltransferase n=1 Tax=Pseudomonas citronellolis TaxID=53408 RepID=UPI0023E42B89|nr:class I SAM-dependent methyltransferase [Pseudomonas citronellolis]MDF3931719.1 class I SAM-dependent methyltransferase [Pseudomonas citronellolis]
MSIRISKGDSEEGVVIGNAYDKYGSRNPLVRWMMAGFEDALSTFVRKVEPTTIHEVGCGEGYWVMRWAQEGLAVRGCDFSAKVIQIARDNASSVGLPEELFQARSIYDLQPPEDIADLVVCCEVLEHLESPELALEALQRVVGGHLILSVPKEPLWCVLNCLRGKYLGQLGNTPGHIQHWSRRRFVELVSKYFEVLEVRNPLPWTMLLCRPLQTR